MSDPAPVTPPAAASATAAVASSPQLATAKLATPVAAAAASDAKDNKSAAPAATAGAAVTTAAATAPTATTTATATASPASTVVLSPEMLNWKYTKPVKCITSEADVPRLMESIGGVEVMGLINSINDKIRGKKRSAPHTQSPAVAVITQFLSDAKAWISTIPPIKQAQRFGNTAFRVWCTKLQSETGALHAALLPASILSTASVELAVYLHESFGNQQRIDYGSGHELNFVCWLTALNKIGILTLADHMTLGLDVIPKYLEVTRELQSIYWLEPAGSKGVWGLDDYNFLPFFWGAAQLMGQEDILPSQLSSDSILQSPAGEEYLLFAAVKFVKKMKSGPFHEHSPLLESVSSVPAWSKVNSGLMKMYLKEVWSKLPIVQHFYFGSLLSYAKAPPHPRTFSATAAAKPKIASRAMNREIQRRVLTELVVSDTVLPVSGLTEILKSFLNSGDDARQDLVSRMAFQLLFRRAAASTDSALPPLSIKRFASFVETLKATSAPSGAPIPTVSARAVPDPVNELWPLAAEPAPDVSADFVPLSTLDVRLDADATADFDFDLLRRYARNSERRAAECERAIRSAAQLRYDQVIGPPSPLPAVDWELDRKSAQVVTARTAAAAPNDVPPATTPTIPIAVAASVAPNIASRLSLRKRKPASADAESVATASVTEDGGSSTESDDDTRRAAARIAATDTANHKRVKVDAIALASTAAGSDVDIKVKVEPASAAAAGGADSFSLELSQSQASQLTPPSSLAHATPSKQTPSAAAGTPASSAAQLPAELLQRVQQLRSEMKDYSDAVLSSVSLSQAGGNTATAATSVIRDGCELLRTIPDHHFRAACALLELSSCSEELLLAVCQSVFVDELSYSRAVLFLAVVMLPIIQRLNQPPSRVLIAIVSVACKHHPKPVIDGLFVPLTVDLQLNPSQAEIVTTLCKDEFGAELQSHLFAEIVRHAAARVGTAGGLAWNESTVLVLSTILGMKPAVDAAIGSAFVSVLEHVLLGSGAASASPLRASVKMVSLILAFVRSFPLAAKPHKSSLLAIGGALTGWTAANVIAQIKKL